MTRDSTIKHSRWFVSSWCSCSQTVSNEHAPGTEETLRHDQKEWRVCFGPRLCGHIFRLTKAVITFKQ